MKRGTYVERRTFIVGSDPSNPQPCISISLPKNCTEIRFKVESETNRVQYGYSFDPSFNRPTIVPNEINGAIAENYNWYGLSYDGSTGFSAFPATKEVIIRKTEDMPNTMYVFVSMTGANSQAVLFYQIIGGSNNGY
tara:strand:+ start:772 stop:1182 length:411 start_codon:yes stop_codon:yes gene_type:complete